MVSFFLAHLPSIAPYLAVSLRESSWLIRRSTASLLKNVSKRNRILLPLVPSPNETKEIRVKSSLMIKLLIMAIASDCPLITSSSDMLVEVSTKNAMSCLSLQPGTLAEIEITALQECITRSSQLRYEVFQGAFFLTKLFLEHIPDTVMNG